MAASFRFKANIGSQVIQVNDQTSAAQATRAARQSMADIISEVKRFIAAVPNIAAEAMYEALLPIKALADEYCPVLTGDMKASGYLEITSYGQQPQVEIGYGRGGEPWYTPIVHEDLNARHEPPTSAKWLERALTEKIDTVPQEVALYIQRNMGFTGTGTEPISAIETATSREVAGQDIGGAALIADVGGGAGKI